MAILAYEEILFFIIVPLMTVLTYLALTKLVAGVRKGRASVVDADDRDGRAPGGEG